jgi:hypothetical protein
LTGPEATEINYARLVGPAGITTLIAGLIGPCLASLINVIQRPGDGGLSAAAPATVFFALAGAVVTMPIGFIGLLIFGIPAARAAATPIIRHPVAAVLVGLISGVLVGTGVGLLLFGRDPFVWFEPLSGGLFGGLWILFARKAIAEFASEQVS